MPFLLIAAYDTASVSSTFGIPILNGQALTLAIWNQLARQDLSMTSLRADMVWKLIQDGALGFVPERIMHDWVPYHITLDNLHYLEDAGATYSIITNGNEETVSFGVSRVDVMSGGTVNVTAIAARDSAAAIHHIVSFIRQCDPAWSTLTVYMPAALEDNDEVRAMIESLEGGGHVVRRMHGVVLVKTIPSLKAAQ